jgi:hypothetical protein
MARWIIITLLSFCLVSCSGFAVYAVDDKPKDDSFVVSTVNAIFDKVNQYSSGEKGILIEDYDKPDEGKKDYATDVLGRKIAEPTIRTVPAKAAEPSKPQGE